jgi:AraC family transcriptional regulator
LAKEIQIIISTPGFSVRHSRMESCEFEPHSHTAFTVASILSGRLLGSVGDERVTLVRGQVALINVGQSHSGHGELLEFVSVSIAPTLVAEVISEIGSIPGSAEILFRSSVVSDESIVAIATTIASELDYGRLGRGAMLESLVRQMVVHLLRSHLAIRRTSSIELSRAGPVDRRLRRAIEFMHDNYSRELDLEEIASAAYLSAFHFARLFKQITGITPHYYLANLRLERARRLLLDTAHPISEIAAMVGYQSQSHFTRVFKSVAGVTPRAYRNGRHDSGA